MKTLSDLLKKIVCPSKRNVPIRGRDAIVDIEFKKQDVEVKTRFIMTGAFGLYHALEFKFGEQIYIGYSGKRNKHNENYILNSLMMHKLYGDQVTIPPHTFTLGSEEVPFYTGPLEKKEEFCGVKIATIPALAKILNDELSDRGLYDEFKFVCEEAVLRNV